jgi:O-antigen/teichoic acid export membrane protein
MNSDKNKILDSKGLRHITKGSALIFSGRAGRSIFTYLFVFARAKILGPFQLGIFELCVAIVRAFSSIAAMGLQTSLIRFVSIYKKANDQAKLKGVLSFSVITVFVSSIALSVALFFSAEFISINVFHELQLTNPLRLFSLSIFLVSIFNIFLSAFRGTKNMKYAAIIDAFQPFAALLLFIIFLFFFKVKIWAAIWAWILSYLACIVVAYFQLIKKLPFLIKKDIKGLVKKKDIISYTLPLAFISIITVFFHQIDMVMIGYFLSPYEVGLYKPASQLALLVSFPLTIFNTVFATTIAEYYHMKKLKELRYLFKVVVRWIFSISLPAVLFIFLLNKELLFLFGKQYGQANQVLVILSIAQLINALVGSVGLTLAMTGRQKILLSVTLFANMLNITLNVILIPSLGITGAAISTLISLGLCNIVCLFFVIKNIKINPFSFNLYKPLVSAAIAFLIVFYVRNHIILENTVSKFGIGLGFLLIYFILSTLLKYEKEEKYIVCILKEKFSKAFLRNHA